MKSQTRSIIAAAAVSLIAALAAVPLSAQSDAPYQVVETGRGYARLQEAVNAIGQGVGTILISAGRHQDCAVQEGGDVRYMAAKGAAGTASLEGAVCEGKAALVLRGRSAQVEGLSFAEIRVPDGNGAGIRLEHGDLLVVQSWFHDSQEGLLTGNDPAATIMIDKSTFTRLGTCEGAGGCAHSVYVGDYGALTVSRSRFEAGRGGHYLKSRSARVAVMSNSFDDSAGKATNYMIDLPAGSTGKIVGNWFVQGRDKENYSAFIAVAAESKVNSSGGLVIEGNDARFAPGVERSSVFVADWSGDQLALGSNLLGEGLARFEKR
ncbi:MAG: right-handed parallel beta-helix repeat-containing protein [Novosphingobium sp.]